MVFIVPNREPENRRVYIDVNTNFQRDNQNLLVNDIQAINNQIYNILATDLGERVFEPEFGSSLRQYIFSPTDDTTAWLIEGEITHALGRWMPRIQVIQSGTFAIPFPEQRYFEVQIQYRIILQRIENSLTFNFQQSGPSTNA